MGPRCLAPLIVLLLFCRHAAAVGNWCVANPSATDAVLLAGLNWACGQGGANCAPLQPGGNCAIPNTIRDHSSYAFNSYYQKDPVPRSCDFGGGAMLTSTDPSTATCKYPSSPSQAASRKLSAGETADKV